MKDQENASEDDAQGNGIIDAEDSESNSEPEWMIELRELAPPKWL